MTNHEERQNLTRTISERVKSPVPTPDGDAQLAEAISKLANHARDSVNAVERNTRRMIWMFVAMLALSVWSRLDEHWSNEQVMSGMARVVEAVEAGEARLGNMEDTLNLVSNAVVNESEADMAASPIDALFAEPEAEPEKASPGTVRYQPDAAREIIKRANGARRAPPEAGSSKGPTTAPPPPPAAPAMPMDVMKARVRAQSSAIQAQVKLAKDPEEKQERVDRYEKLKAKAEKVGVELPELPTEDAK